MLGVQKWRTNYVACFSLPSTSIRSQSDSILHDCGFESFPCELKVSHLQVPSLPSVDTKADWRVWLATWLNEDQEVLLDKWKSKNILQAKRGIYLSMLLRYEVEKSMQSSIKQTAAGVSTTGESHEIFASCLQQWLPLSREVRYYYHRYALPYLTTNRAFNSSTIIINHRSSPHGRQYQQY